MDVKIATRSVVEGEVVVLEEAAQAAGPVALLLDNYLLELVAVNLIALMENVKGCV